MAVELECVSGESAGRRLVVTGASPQVFRLFDHGQEAATVTVSLHDSGCRLVSQGPRLPMVNGQPCAQVGLLLGDRVEIGRDLYVVRAAEESRAVRPGSAYIPHTAGAPRCAACGAGTDGSGAWREGGQALCTDCLAQGHSPKALPVDQALARRADGGAQPARQRRAISASMQALPPTSEPGLWSRLRALMKGRGRLQADRRRLDQLQQERRELLLDAGRHALSQAFLGLPEDAFATLLRGTPVTLTPIDLSRVGIDHWREARERLALLDAEIAALRSSLGLGLDPERSTRAHLALRTQDRARVDRVFTTLDDMNTQELDPASGVRPATQREVHTAPLAPKGRRG